MNAYFPPSSYNTKELFCIIEKRSKKLILLLVFYCLVGTGRVQAGIALINHTGIEEVGSTNSIDTSGANFIVVVCHYYQPATISVSDNKGNTWHKISTYGSGDNTYGWAQLAYAYNATTGTGHFFTCSPDPGGYNSITVTAYSGVKSSSDPLDTSNGNNSSPPTTVQPGGVSPSQTGDLLVTAYSSAGSSGSSASISPSPTFTITDTEYNGSGMDGGMAYAVVSDTNSYNPTWTVNNETQGESAVIAAFKSASSSSSRGVYLGGGAHLAGAKLNF